MEREPSFEIFKSLLVRSHLNNDPSLTEEELQKIRKRIDSEISIETPLSELGLDSMTMTWIVVRLEEELDIDASGVSFFEIFNVKDLLEKLEKLA